tara:strand:- start:169 stop:867 length:699 start_codon:yes stop_codon:yes gene_type:complete
MNLLSFINTLFDDGIARVPVIRDPAEPDDDTSTSTAVPEDDLDEVADALASYERMIRADWPLSPPPLDQGVAIRSATFLYQAARLVLSRQVSEDESNRLLSASPITEESASAHYSVDLTGRFLPDLLRLAGGVLSDDPVVAHLKQFGKRWPLSSVGIAELEIDSARLDAVLADPALKEAYVDRVLRLGDCSRLVDPRVAEAARTAIGPHTGLVGASISAALWPAEEPSATVE